MNRTTSQSLEDARATLLTQLALDIVDQRVLDAMGRVQREEFVADEAAPVAYQNRPLPIGHGQTISQPLMVALMTQALMLTDDERVLEVGTGSGYQAAIISLLTAHVVSVERVPELATSAAERLEHLGYGNVEVHAVSDELGWPEGAPYNGIIVTAASPDIPRRLLDQLAMNGRLVLPVGSRSVQELVRIVKTPEGAQRHNLGSCRFVPLLGRGAWPEAR